MKIKLDLSSTPCVLTSGQPARVWADNDWCLEGQPLEYQDLSHWCCWIGGGRRFDSQISHSRDLNAGPPRDSDETDKFPIQTNVHAAQVLKPPPHPAVLPHLQRFETPDKAPSAGCPQEDLGAGCDTAADCRLRLTHRTEVLVWTGTQKKKKQRS